jgi:REP element-mobilizing transposase RayT
LIPLETNKHYHIYNRANGNEKIFLNDDNYLFFINKYKKHIDPICDTFSYCLIPNHFHLLIRFKVDFLIEKFINYNNKNDIYSFFSNLFSRSYTQAFNKQQNRKVSLFMKPFKRKEIKDEFYLKKLIHYIHLNPVEAGLCSKPNLWKYSSFNAIVSGKRTNILKSDVINYFDDLENFHFIHTQPSKLSGIE